MLRALASARYFAPTLRVVVITPCTGARSSLSRCGASQRARGRRLSSDAFGLGIVAHLTPSPARRPAAAPTTTGKSSRRAAAAAANDPQTPPPAGRRARSSATAALAADAPLGGEEADAAAPVEDDAAAAAAPAKRRRGRRAPDPLPCADPTPRSSPRSRPLRPRLAPFPTSATPV